VPGRVLIDIATTGGPATLRAAGFDAEARRSAMVLYDQNHVPVGVDAHFDGFDRNLRRALAGMGVRTPGTALILEVDRTVDAGRSWQLALAAVHALIGLDRLAVDEAGAERVLWITGAVGTSLWEAQPVEAVTAKLRRSAERIGALRARGIAVEVVVPEGNLAEARAAAPQGVRVIGIARVADLVHDLTLPETRIPAARAPRRRLLWAGAGIGALAAIGLGAGLGQAPGTAALFGGGGAGQGPAHAAAPSAPVPNSPAAPMPELPVALAALARPGLPGRPAAPAPPSDPPAPPTVAAPLLMRALRPAPGLDCRQSDFTGAALIAAPPVALPGAAVAVGPRLCGLLFAVPEGGAAPRIALDPPSAPGIAPAPPAGHAGPGLAIAPWRLRQPVTVTLTPADGGPVRRLTLGPARAGARDPF